MRGQNLLKAAFSETESSARRKGEWTRQGKEPKE